MPTLFTRILKGEAPARFVWRDPDVAAFLTIAPVRPGHTLIVPAVEVDHWIDLDTDGIARTFAAARRVARGIQRAFPCRKIGMSIVGLEVPHTHLHLIPIDSLRDMDFSKQDSAATPEALDDAAARIRRALKELGDPCVTG
jgi:histidine triad (HIT) family protein